MKRISKDYAHMHIVKSSTFHIRNMEDNYAKKK